MKALLVPTDFSAAADNALLYAARLAETCQASLFLVNVYQVPISMNDVPVLMASVEELRVSSEAGLGRSLELLAKNFPGVVARTESRMGDIVTEVADMIQEIKPFAIVVGKHSGSGMERIIFGSTTLSLIRHSRIPVIAVPANYTRHTISNMALALDTSGGNLQLPFLKSFTDAVRGQLHLIHVQTDSRPFEKPEALAESLNAECHTIRDHEFLHGMQTYTTLNNIDLLIVFPHRHSFLERFFLKTHTKELVEKLSTPLMTIPEHEASLNFEES